MNTTSGERSSTRGRVLAQLRQRIVSLDLAPRTSLSENDLASELGVSRTPVRESLIILREEGLVRVYPQIGSFVAPIDVGRVAEAQFVREALECAALGEVAPAVSADLLTALDESLEAQRIAAREGDSERFFELDEEFHLHLLRLSGHDGIWSTVVAEKTHLDRARRLSLVDARPLDSLIEQHAAVVDAVRDGRVETAVEALREHLRMVFEDIEQIRARHPELFSTGDDRPTRRMVATLS
ncbi:GntR family transcriptional regulator [Leifsonia sp. McL0607]|uniref:GntR family transcriptional regulator n=1 Tax=Leifsonia sp. McL0607 TaxID=3415672 RepID=UPI003CEE2DCA